MLKLLIKAFMLTILFVAYCPFNALGQSIELENFGSGFNNPTSIKHAGDDRLFIVEQDGYIQILNSNGSTNTTAFLNIDSRVSDFGGERGLLGLAFHPNYSSNGYFYVNYNDNSGDTVISRFTVNSTDPNNPGFNTADPNSELVLFNISQPSDNHNGGDLVFGNDNNLYIALGDGGFQGDPNEQAQSLNSLLGKILRIDVDNPANGNNYGIPTSNPFYNDGNANTRDEIWAYGLRNPWKFSFDEVLNDIWIADVGQNEYEEINLISSAASLVNYGWRCYEGNHIFNTSGNCPSDISTLTFPIAEYSHNNSGTFKCSITGGFRYRGAIQTSLSGIYFFADYCSNEIGMLIQNGANWDMTFTSQYSGNNWSTFGEDINGELYIAGRSSGDVFKIVEASLNIDEFSTDIAFKIYPNPSNSGITVLDFTDSVSSIKQVSMYTMSGKIIHVFNDINARVYDISTSNLSSGVYIVEATASSGNKTRKKLLVY